MDLFTPLARTTDCDESKAAAVNSVNFSGKHRERILSALVTPMGKDAIANATGLTSVQVDRRLHELHKAGLIEPTGRKVKSNANCFEREWMLIQKQ